MFVWRDGYSTSILKVIVGIHFKYHEVFCLESTIVPLCEKICEKRGPLISNLMGSYSRIVALTGYVFPKLSIARGQLSQAESPVNLQEVN